MRRFCEQSRVAAAVPAQPLLALPSLAWPGLVWPRRHDASDPPGYDRGSRTLPPGLLTSEELVHHREDLAALHHLRPSPTRWHACSAQAQPAWMERTRAYTPPRLRRTDARMLAYNHTHTYRHTGTDTDTRHRHTQTRARPRAHEHKQTHKLKIKRKQTDTHAHARARGRHAVVTRSSRGRHVVVTRASQRRP